MAHHLYIPSLQQAHSFIRCTSGFIENIPQTKTQIQSMSDFDVHCSCSLFILRSHGSFFFFFLNSDHTAEDEFSLSAATTLLGVRQIKFFFFFKRSLRKIERDTAEIARKRIYRFSFPRQSEEDGRRSLLACPLIIRLMCFRKFLLTALKPESE